jgi:hypothetical protein
MYSSPKKARTLINSEQAIMGVMILIYPTPLALIAINSRFFDMNPRDMRVASITARGSEMKSMYGIFVAKYHIAVINGT